MPLESSAILEGGKLMKKAWVLVGTFLFVSIAAHSQTSRPVPPAGEALAVILAQPAGTGACPAQQNQMLFAATSLAVGMEKSVCYADANCGSYILSCFDYFNPYDCSGIDRNCQAGEQGSVTCDGVTQRCDPCECTTGTPREQACCRCSLWSDCLDCCVCQYGLHATCDWC
jgi:hypothetical protein